MVSFGKPRLIWSVALVLSVPLTIRATSGMVQYNRDVRPILSENCFACHGTDSASRKGGLRLDRVEDATAPRKDSEPAIVPGKPNGSALVHRIYADDPDDIMPPKKSHKVLTPAEKAVLKRWIASLLLDCVLFQWPPCMAVARQ